MRFLFDEHVSLAAARELVRRGIDITHVVDIPGLVSAPDPVVLEHAIEEDRILVTRNYRDFAPLVDGLNRLGRSLPGVLFLPTSVPQNDPGAHVRAIENWLRDCPPGSNPVENTYLWLH